MPEREDRYVFEEVAYLLLFGRLPNGADLERMTRSLGVRRELPPGFLVDSIMQSPSNNIMNKLARSILSLYSYSDVTENTTIEDEMSIALDLIRPRCPFSWTVPTRQSGTSMTTPA